MRMNDVFITLHKYDNERALLLRPERFERGMRHISEIMAREVPILQPGTLQEQLVRLSEEFVDYIVGLPVPVVYRATTVAALHTVRGQRLQPRSVRSLRRHFARQYSTEQCAKAMLKQKSLSGCIESGRRILLDMQFNIEEDWGDGYNAATQLA